MRIALIYVTKELPKLFRGRDMLGHTSFFVTNLSFVKQKLDSWAISIPLTVLSSFGDIFIGIIVTSVDFLKTVCELRFGEVFLKR